MKNKLTLIILLFISGLLAVNSSRAQQLAQHNWYFGNSVDAIRFNRSNGQPAVVSNQAIPFGTGGSAVASDPANADLLFYSDGAAIYDACHLVMTNGNGLTGNSSGNQPAAICGVPGQPKRYFVFTNTASFTTGGTISRSVVDLARFGNAIFPSPPMGEVESKNVAIPGLTARSEGMITVPHANGNDFWLISHQNNSQTFSATLINAAAYTGTFTTINSTSAQVPTTVANFAYHAPTRRLAVSAQDTNTDAIILNFNDATGVLTFDRTIFNSGLATAGNQSIYDIEWSASGRFLYLSRHGETGVAANVLQYDYANATVSLASVLSAPVFRSYGLQQAPDSAIYHLYQAVAGGPFLVGRFTRTDTVAAAVRHTPTPFGNRNFNATQFPSFLPRDTVRMQVNFSFVGTCQNSPTAFFPDVLPAADSLFWAFGDNTFSRGWSPIHTYGTASTFTVRLRAFYRGQVDSVALPVTINPFPLEIQLVQDTTACRSEFPPPRGSSSPQQFRVTLQTQGGTPQSITWSNGDTGPTLTPDSAGYYYAVVTDASGCSAYAGVNVKEYGLQNQTANIWYFGNRAGIDFNRQPPVALNNSAMNAPEGCAIVCDRNGSTIFYTDGDRVYDRTHVEIDVGLGGSPDATQSSLIVPVQGDETLFYIFTTQAINGTSALELRYSLFDLKENNGRGLVVKKNVLLFSRSTERITANGRWVIAKEYGNNTFRAYAVSATGISDPVFSSIGSDHSFKFQQNGEGYMKLGPRNSLAVPLSSPGTSNLIELFHLNDTTGRLSRFRSINLNDPNGQIYGMEFSPGGNKLFATLKNGATSKIFEYSIDSLERPAFRQQVSQPAELGALQIAPNGQIYIAINNSNSLGLVLANEDTTQLSSFNLSGFALASGTNSRLGLPNFRQQNINAFGGPDIDFSGVCLGDSTQFVGTATDAIDEFQWFFGDGASSTESNPVHLYAAANTFNVSLRITNRCSLDTTLVASVTINNPPPRPSLPGATALCTGNVTLDANTPNTPNLIHLWSTGETTRTLVVTQPSTLSVTNTSTTTGCTSEATTIIADNRPQLDLGPDLTLCEDNATPALNAFNPGAIFQWRINGTNSSTSQTQAVDVTTPGVFRYEVTVTDPITTCTVTDSKTYTINVSPQFTLTTVNTSTCTSNNGQVTLNINPSSPAGGPYQFFISGPGTADNGIDRTAPATITLTGKGAGTYSAVVTDQISGCTLSTSAGLSTNGITVSATSASVCEPLSISVTSSFPPVDFPLQYSVSNNGTQVIAPTSVSAANFTIPNIPATAGTTTNYVVQIQDRNGCIATDDVAVTTNPPVTVTLQPNLCTLTLTASGGNTYTWSATPATAITGSTSGATVALTPNAGSATFTVTATGGAGTCPATQSTTLNVGNGIPTPTLAQSSPCADTATLTATPATGGFQYRWFRNGTLDNSLGGSQLILTTANNGTSYTVQLYNPLDGCTTPVSAPLTASVVGVITGSLTATPACQDGNPFTLTAATTATGVTFTWFFNNSTTAIPNATGASLTRTEEGIYRVELSRASCQSASEITITRAPVPVGQLPNRVVICADPDNRDATTRTIDLNPGNFAAYNWFKNELTLNFRQQVLTADSQGSYEVEITNVQNCTSRDRTEVLSECLPKIEAPNAFRPGSSVADNRNFRVFTFFITDDFNIFIYNRWGELVFTANNKDFTWNGNYNNGSEPLPPGTYSYVIKYVSAFRPDRGVQEKRGGVALLR
jgi:gliding motility-associated-like protein